MATVAIIHAADDALPARALAEKLRAAKLTVVLEKTPGEELRSALKGANVTIALWSPRSVGQAALADDASFAKGKTKLIHAAMQNASPPDAFRNDKVVNLTGWRGEDEFPAWRELAKQVTEKAGVAPLPPPAPRLASGFFQPGAANPGGVAHPSQLDHGRNAPHQRAAAIPPRTTPQAASRPAPQQTAPRQAPQAAPRQAPAPPQRATPPRSAPPPYVEREERASGGGGKGMMIGIITFVVVAVIGAGGYYFWSQGQSAQTTSAAWEQVDHNDAGAIRAFLGGDPGDQRDDAQQALAQLEERSFEAASDSDTIDGFEGFLNDFPESQHALAARGRIAELQTMTPAATEEGAEAVPVEGVTNPDLVPPGATTPVAPTTTGGPATLTPPATETPPANPEPAGPTN